MNSFSEMWQEFVKQFITRKGYENVLKGLGITVEIAVLGLLIGILIGTLIAVVRVMPKYKTLPRVLDKICGGYVELFRGTPMVVQLLIGYWVLLPALDIQVNSGVPVAIIMFGLNSGAYVSEIMRGGINSVDPGQMEAGRALGLSFLSTMLLIVIPQAIKNILPTLGNEFITLVKETSIVGFVGATDICVAFRYIGTNNYEFMVPYIVMALIYIVLVLFIPLLIRLMERRLKRSDRTA